MLWELFEPGFLATYSQYLSDESVGLVRAFGPLVSRWIDGRDDPISVTHGDYRLDNLLFGTAAGGPPVTAVDWQTPGHGSPIADVSYFCGAGLLPEDRRAHEHDLLTVYIDALGSYEVEVDESWVFEQYRRESFAGVLMALVASQVVGTSERSEAMFAAMASRHLQHCLDLDAIDAV
jgi:aminoglycoside phosphotransferase (APT) family kinase protein